MRDCGIDRQSDDEAGEPDVKLCMLGLADTVAERSCFVRAEAYGAWWLLRVVSRRIRSLHEDQLVS